jgi:hypothetical protein
MLFIVNSDKNIVLDTEKNKYTQRKLNHITLSVPDECYFSNAMCALNL